MRHIHAALVCFLLAGSLFGQGAPLTGTAALHLTSPSGPMPTIAIGQTVVVNLFVDVTGMTGQSSAMMTVPVALGGYNVTFTYDNTKLQFVSLSGGTATGYTGTPLNGPDDQSLGTIYIAAVKPDQNNHLPVGNVSVATLTFTARAAAQSTSINVSVDDLETETRGYDPPPVGFTAPDTSFPLLIPPPPATHLSVTAPATAAPGTPFNLTVGALDASNTIVPSYAGNVHFTSSDVAAALPGDYTFTPGDAGQHIFPVTLNTTGSRTVTAADLGDSSVNGLATIAVKAPTTTTLSSTPNPSLDNQSVLLTAQVTSATAGTITGNVTFRDDTTILGTSSLSSGTATLNVPSFTAGSHSLTATYNGDTIYLTSVSSITTHSSTATHLDPPVTLSATAVASNQINVVWPASPNATSYDITRSSGAGFALIGTSLVPSFADTTVSPATSYLYKVRARNSATVSIDSIGDLATSVVFSDDPIIATVTIMKAAHIMDLRTAANAVRALASLAPATFTDSTVNPGDDFRTVHITELRDALDPARSSLGLPAISYTDPVLMSGMVRRAAHVQELRDGVK